jgi:hypothetical protein
MNSDKSEDVVVVGVLHIFARLALFCGEWTVFAEFGVNPTKSNQIKPGGKLAN